MTSKVSEYLQEVTTGMSAFDKGLWIRHGSIINPLRQNQSLNKAPKKAKVISTAGNIMVSIFRKPTKSYNY